MKYHTLFFQKLGKMSQNLSSAAVVIGTLRVKMAPGVWGILGEWLFIFRELGSTGNYFRGAREHAHNFWDIGSVVKKQKKK